MTTQQIEETYDAKETTNQEETAAIEQSIPLPRTLTEGSDEVKQHFLTQIVQHLSQGYISQDYVREVRVHPEDVETVAVWLENMEMPPIVRQLLGVAKNDGNTCVPAYVMQSQIETHWLSQYYKKTGLYDLLKDMESPIILGHKDLKQLFLAQAMEKLREQRRIIVPGL